MPARWTKEEEEYIETEHARGCTIFGMALVLNRSRNAIYDRLSLLRKRKREQEAVSQMSGQIKKVKLGGKLQVSVDGNKLLVEASEGYCVAIAADEGGSVIWAYHPMSGWYVEGSMEHGGGTPDEQ